MRIIVMSGLSKGIIKTEILKYMGMIYFEAEIIS